jgi:F5/8 type C domain
VDGNTNGGWSGGSVTHTAEDGSPQPWWQVDLGTDTAIRSLAVWNRTDCCSERLTNYYVLVSSQPFGGGTLADDLAQPGVTAAYQASTAGSPTSIPLDGVTGRYVRVRLVGNAPLSLAEVELMAGAAEPPPQVEGSRTFVVPAKCEHLQSFNTRLGADDGHTASVVPRCDVAAGS